VNVLVSCIHIYIYVHVHVYVFSNKCAGSFHDCSWVCKRALFDGFPAYAQIWMRSK